MPSRTSSSIWPTRARTLKPRSSPSMRTSQASDSSTASTASKPLLDHHSAKAGHVPALERIRPAVAYLGHPAALPPMSWLTLARMARSHGGVAVPVWSRHRLVIASWEIRPLVGNHRYFASESVKDDHYRSKRHKKRVKAMSGPAPHTQLDAELAAGMGKPDNGLKLMSM
ncbi:unnamed protein product [Miscanthus lutarioriparius]|uniref:Uncharacterized protein n=1 Tax=Miscanthus lutarioriparius TaxID=422564 RepID=A0A811R4A0_9POAL|nr:unnamed protein product [Miscanthus lutarioriparius]